MNKDNPDSSATRRLLDLVRGGDAQALDDLLKRARPALRAFIEMRLDPKVAGRIDPSDVVQETQLAAARRIDDFLHRQPMPFYLWLRKTAYEQLLDTHKFHRRRRRSVAKEAALPERSSLLLAMPLLKGKSSPSQRLQAKELAARLAEAVRQLADIDQEILLMRHGEEMSFKEIACVLDIEASAARKRFGRALIRLQRLLTDQGLLE